MSDESLEEYEFSSSELKELEELIGVCAKRVDDSDDLSFLKYRDVENGDVDYRIGGNVVKGLLGSGGQSICFLARDEILQRDVVIKLYRDGLKPIRKEQVVREGRALAKIDSPNVARCYSTGNFDGRPYLALEYVKGKTLEQWTHSEKVDPDIALGFVRQITEGIRAIHSRNLLHLDLKPSNVIIDQNGRAVMIDFGLSVSCFETVSELVEGTAAFIAPERLMPELVDQRADIFGIGAILYYLLCGKPPRDLTGNASKVEIAQKQFDFDTLESSCNSAFAIEVCRRCLAPDPDNRFQSADELSKFLDSGPRTHRVQSAAVAGLAVLAFSIFGWLMLSSSSQNTTYTVRQDFEISYQIAESDWRHFHSESLQDVEIFQLGSTYEFRFKAVIPCYISVFSLECASGSPTLNNFERVYADFDKEIPAGSVYRKPIDPFPATPSGQTEFLCFVASSQPLDADAIGTRITNELQLQWKLDSDSASRLHFVRTMLANAISHSKLNAQVASVRGVNKELGRQQFSEGIIPYRAID